MDRYKKLVESWREGVLPSETDAEPTSPKPTLVPDDALRALDRTPLRDALITSMLDSSQPMCVCDAAGELVFANTPYRNLLALTARGTNGLKGSLAYHEMLHPLLLEASERDETVSIGNLSHQYRARHIALLDRNGDFAGSYGVFTDLTGLNTSQHHTVLAIEHSDLLIRSIADWIWETDADLAIVNISRGVSGITGLPPKLLVGLSLRDLGSFDETETGRAGTEEIFRRRTPFRNIRYLMTDTEGRERYFNLSGMPVFSDEGRRFSGYHGTATEITAQIEAEA
jgi:PAS domain S-box-containing protein